MSQTIKLYSIVCGLYADEQVFPPYPNIDMNFYPDLDKVQNIYDSITAQSFDQKEVILARMNGYKTYTKYIIQVEMPLDIYQECFEDEPGYPHTEEERQGFVNSSVFSDGVNHDFENVKDKLFEICGGLSKLHINNLRQYKPELATA